MGFLNRLAAAALALLPLACASGARPLDLPPWVSGDVGCGVVWHHAVPASLAGGPQSIHVVEVPPEARGAFKVVVSTGGAKRFSELAGATSAIAGVNGGYFDGNGASVGFVRAGARDLARNPANRAPRGVVGFPREGRPRFRRLAASDAWDEVPEALGAGPILVEGGRPVEDFAAEGFGDPKFVGKNPRTAIGVDGAGRVFLVTVDGRRADAAGMSLPELAAFLRDVVGCVDALNLDGGGSTTCWLRRHGVSAVVNRPSDAAGERAVANGLVFVPAP